MSGQMSPAQRQLLIEHLPYELEMLEWSYEIKNQEWGPSGQTMRVVICGGGVIGACAAYSRRGIEVIVVERTEVAVRQGRRIFGARRCAGTPLDVLARRSFQLHAALPHNISGDWGYRRMTAYSGFIVPERHTRRHSPAALSWLSKGVIIEFRLGTTETTAIVHPRKFTFALMHAAQGHGTELRHERVTGIVRSADGSTVRGVAVDDGVIEAGCRRRRDGTLVLDRSQMGVTGECPDWHNTKA